MNRRYILIVAFIITAACVLLVGTAAAQSGQPEAPEAVVTSKFTYQGKIGRNEVPFTGSCDMRFTLWNAATAGTQQGSLLNVNAVNVDNGIFTVELDFGNQFKGEARWIQTEAKCADDADYTALPRVALTPTPYAIGLMPGAQVLGNIPGTAGILRALNDGPGAALVGLANSSSGVTYGVLGNAFSPYGVAISGYADGGATGVQGWSDSSGAGVWGRSATGIGVFGESAIYEGVRGVAHDVNHGAVVGIHDGGGIGVYGNSVNGAGVVGESNIWVGVYGASTNQAGVWGKSTNGYGVYGESTNSFAGYFQGKVGIAGGADLAELFDLSEQAEPGTLMIIDAKSPGHLTISTRAYDSKVAGIVSGAGGVKPGLTLHQQGVLEGNTEVAIAGRVYVKATALNGAIEPGDLLTTSNVPGHAMKATDSDRSHGAIIGKAMTGLDSGTGLVLVLVNLQ
jgi:hypothetical protein